MWRDKVHVKNNEKSTDNEVHSEKKQFPVFVISLTESVTIVLNQTSGFSICKH